MTPAELVYYLGYSLKKRFSLRRRKSLSHKVISIGNLTAGGTGKTPAAIAIAEEAQKRGYSPVILTRGYRGKAKGPCFVTRGSGLLLSVDEAGDEPVVMAERLKDVPVVKSADRYNGGIFAIHYLGTGNRQFLFILDDGFQHWRISRDVDIVLIDGLDPFGNRKLLPIGPLRGPVTELKDADILVITKAMNEGLTEELKTVNPDAAVYYASYEITGLRSPDSSQMDAGLLREKSVFAFCGIANPRSFKETLSALGCRVVDLKHYRDHYHYVPEDVRAIERKGKNLGVDFLVTTEKDMVKIRDISCLPPNLLSVEIGFRAEKEFFNDLFKRIEL